MTAPISNRPSPLVRSNTTPASTESKPALQRSNTSPASLSSPATKPAAEKPAAPQRTNSTPVTSQTEKPAAPQRSNTAPASVTPPKDTLEAAGTTAAASAKQGLLGKYIQNATQAAHDSGTAGAFGKTKALGGLGASAAGIGVNAKGLVDGIKNHDGQAIAASAIGLGKSTLSTIKGGLDAAAMFEAGKGFKGLKGAAEAALGAEGKAAKNIASKVAEAVHSGKELRNVDVLGELAKSKGLGAKIGTTLKQGAADALHALPGKVGDKAAGKLEGSIAKAGEKVAASGAHGLTDAAKNGLKTGEAVVDAAKGAEAALKGGATAAKVGVEAAGTAAKLAGRFAPGLNVGIAALDTANAARTIADPKASVAAKVTSGITAAGSIVAATNIPVVSQIGAAVSTASTVVGAAIEHAGAIKDVAKKAGEGIKNFFKGW